MTEITQTYNINNSTTKSKVTTFPQGESIPEFKLEAHSSKNMKVKPPTVTPNDLIIKLPKQKVFSDQEATKKMQAINTDIYIGAKKEKEKHEFNTKRYFTIFSIFALITAAIAYFRKK